MTRTPQDDRRHGFTLVELLVVVGIIGVLLGLIIPAVHRASQMAKLVQCTANTSTITRAILTSAAENGGRMPYVQASPSPAQFWFDKNQVGRFLVDEDHLPLKKPAGGVLVCPADEGKRSYSMNAWANSRLDSDIIANGGGPKPWGGSAKPPGNAIVLIEAYSYTGSSLTGYLAPSIVGVPKSTAGQRFGGDGGLKPFWAGRFGWVNCELDYSRHRKPGSDAPRSLASGRLNIGYVDGHVALKAYEDLVDERGRSTGDSMWFPNETR